MGNQLRKRQDKGLHISLKCITNVVSELIDQLLHAFSHALYSALGRIYLVICIINVILFGAHKRVHRVWFSMCTSITKTVVSVCISLLNKPLFSAFLPAFFSACIKISSVVNMWTNTFSVYIKKWLNKINNKSYRIKVYGIEHFILVMSRLQIGCGCVCG